MEEASAASKASQKQLDLAFQFLFIFFFSIGVVEIVGREACCFILLGLMVGTYYNLFCRQNKSQSFYETGIFRTEDHLHL